MMYSKKVGLLLTLALLMSSLMFSSVFFTAPAAAQGTGDWPQWRHDPQHTGYNPTSSGPNQLQLVWQYETLGMVRSSPAVTDNKVFIGSDDGNVYCFDATSGALNWKFQTGGAVTSSPAVVGGICYVGSFDHNVYAISESSGSLVWKYTTKYLVYSSPCVVDNKVFIGSNDDHLYCLTADTGKQIWNFTFRLQNTAYGGSYTANYDSASPAVYAGRVYIGWGDQYVYCLNESNGAKFWEYKGTTAPATGTIAGQYGFRESSPCVPGDGSLFIGSLDTGWYRLNISTAVFANNQQRLMWYTRYNTALGTNETNDNIEQTSAAYAFGAVFTQYSGPHMIMRQNIKTGAAEGIGNMGILCRSSLAAADNKLYCGNNDRGFYIWKASDASRIQSIWFSEPIESSPAIAYGKVYFGGLNKWVYCYQDGETKRLNNLYVNPQPRIVPLGTNVGISGSINPFHENGPEGQTITLTYVKPDGSDVVRTVVTQTASVFSDSYTPDQEGTWKVMASWAGNPWWLPSTSFYQSFYVTAAVVKPTTTISASVSNATITLNNAVTVSGTISPTVNGVTVTLTYTKPDGTSLTRTALSGNGGTYADTYTPTTEGSWSVTASWAGNDDYQGSTSSAATFTVSAATTQPSGGGAAIAPEVIYAIVAIIVIVIIAVIGYWYMKRPKK